jgi:predicted DNA-binding protein
VPAESLCIRLPPGTKDKLMSKYGKKYKDKVREAIAKLIED